jgi:hypothetical protein
MARRLVLLAFIAAALFASVCSASRDDPSGNWYRPTVEGMIHAPLRTKHTLYRRNASGVTEFAWDHKEGFEAAVYIARNMTAGGWDALRLEYDRNLFSTEANSLEGYYAAGFAEGYLTFADSFFNYDNQIAPVVAQLQQVEAGWSFVQEHIAFVNAFPLTTGVGRQLGRQTRLIQGNADGWMAAYNAFGKNWTNITYTLGYNEFYYMNYQNGLGDVLSKYTPSAQLPRSVKDLDMHCSALMKLTDDDLFFAHDTWAPFNTMLRQYKIYDFGPTTVYMSGYAGFISSTDDFYMTSNQLAVTETTNGNMNASLWQYLVPDLIPEFHRVMIANFLARSPEGWFKLFAFDNSGTYNNQYMVADMAAARRAIDEKRPLPRGSFYVGEQIPGMVVFDDQTDFLNQNKHWPSYNIPFYPLIYNLSGFAAADTNETYGYYNYHKYARAVIFKRMQGLVTNYSTMWYLMRYNNWQQDPASAMKWCTQNGGPAACNVSQASGFAIASRFDLGPAPTELEGPAEVAGFVARGMFGAIDTKLTSAKWLTGSYRAVIQNGPTAVQNPVFNYTAFVAANPELDEPWKGLATVFDFPPVLVEAEQS